MTDIQNPTPWSDYDFLEFEGFVSKVEWEGYSYAAENYSPDFEASELQERASTSAGLKALYRENRAVVDAWYETVGGKRACDLHNDHVDESRKRADDSCLWGVRCTDGYVVHCGTEAYRDEFVATALGNSRYRQPAALLHRSVPGSEWTETPLPIAATS